MNVRFCQISQLFWGPSIRVISIHTYYFVKKLSKILSDLSFSPISVFSTNLSTFWGPSIRVISIQAYYFVNKLGKILSDLSLSPISLFPTNWSTFWSPAISVTSIHLYYFVNRLGEISSDFITFDKIPTNRQMLSNPSISSAKFHQICHFHYCMHLWTNLHASGHPSQHVWKPYVKSLWH